MAPTDRTTMLANDPDVFGLCAQIHGANSAGMPWTDTTTPRTERPVRFHPRPHFWRKLCFAPLSRITRQ